MSARWSGSRPCSSSKPSNVKENVMKQSKINEKRSILSGAFMRQRIGRDSSRERGMIPVLPVLLMAILLFSCSVGNENAAPAESGTIYTCPMHPQIREKQPGDCPLCGMDLVAVSEAKVEASTEAKKNEPESQPSKDPVFTCPMHPQIRENKPGDCPLCGMDLVDVSESDEKHSGHEDKEATAGSTSAGSVFTCPMHPQIREEESADCPLCGMDLVKAGSDGKSSSADQGEGAGTVVELGKAKNAILSAETETAGPHAMTREIEIFGEIEAIRDVLVRYSWDYSGRVESVLPDFNRQSYRQGEPILNVYSAEAVAEQERLIELWRKRWLRTFYERRNLESQIEAVKARLSEAGMTEEDFKKLEDGHVRKMFTLKSPVSGSVLMAPPEVGSQFRAGETLFEIADLSSVWFVGDVFEKDIGYLKSGQQAAIQSQGLPGESFQGTLVYLGRSLNGTTRTLPVRFLVENVSDNLLPKLSGTARLKVSLGDDRVTVPAKAVLETGKRSVVYVAEGEGVYRLRTVKTGLRTDERIEILEGVESGEEVVTDGAFLLDAEAQLSGQRGD